MENQTPDQRIRDVQHFGEQGGVVPVMDVAATSTFMRPEDMERAFRGEMSGCYLYSRQSNPTVRMFSEKLAAMEGMEAALGVASGMAAIYAAIRQLLPEGGHIVCSRTVYGGTYALFQNMLPKIGIKVSFVDSQNLSAVEKAITPETKAVYVETMSNPLLRVADLPGLSSICKKRNLKLVVDNTFTPLIVTPSKYGVDVVVYSCTKYISGSSDLMAGAIVSSQAFINELIDINHGMVMLTGPVMDTTVAHQLYLRLDHLPVRMRAHAECAQYLANGLIENKVQVVYPGLKSHPDFKTFEQLGNAQYGAGGMLAVDCGSSERAMKLANMLQEEKFGLYAVSLGFSRTLMSCPSVSTSSEIPEAEQVEMGLSRGLLRLSIGYIGANEEMLKRFLKCWKAV